MTSLDIVSIVACILIAMAVVVIIRITLYGKNWPMRMYRVLLAAIAVPHLLKAREITFYCGHTTIIDTARNLLLLFLFVIVIVIHLTGQWRMPSSCGSHKY